MADTKAKLEFWRQLDIVTPDKLPPVTMIGVGGIGSFAVMALAKMGCQDITVIDPDKVENHNLPNQLYRVGNVGDYKVEAAQWLCREFADVHPLAFNELLGDQRLEGVVISGVDSMAARKDIWQKVKMKPSIPLYIEARMGAEVCRIYSFNPCDPTLGKWYEKEQLYSDEEASEAPCTARAIIYTGFMIAALIASQVKKFAVREVVHKEIIFSIRDLDLMKD